METEGFYNEDPKGKQDPSDEHLDEGLEPFDVLYERAKAEYSSTELTEEEKKAISNINQPIQYE
jgi:hypothetical protein